VDEKTLILIASYSGNTEETVSCYQEALDKNLSHIVLTTGGKLEEIANKNDSTIYKIPRGLQPRLSTGYFIAGVIKMLMNMDLIPDVSRMVLDAASQISESLDEEKAKTTAKNLKNKVPILYSTFENKSIARISKIKFNENSKTQAFWYYFPELNHNEMVGFSNLIMDPYFIIMKSQYTHERNNKRMEIFKKLLEEKGAEVQIYEMSGDNILEEMLNAYYFIDHVTYYLSENYGIDPEPVDMVENFKKYMKE
jgi:glucose/mannose-6-phosphate isomerase